MSNNKINIFYFYYDNTKFINKIYTSAFYLFLFIKGFNYSSSVYTLDLSKLLVSNRFSTTG